MLLFFILFFPISLALRLRSLNLPNKITLLESQKTSGKTNIIFSQDPSYYFYLLTTPPLIQSNEADFECQITNEYFNVSTKESSSQKYSAKVDFLVPSSDSNEKNYDIHKNPSGEFTFNVRIGKKTQEGVDISNPDLKTHYASEKKEEKKDGKQRNIDTETSNLVNDLIQNGENNVAEATSGLMENLNNALNSPGFTKEVEQFKDTPETLTEQVSNAFKKGQKDIFYKLNRYVNMDQIFENAGTISDKEEFAKHAAEVLESGSVSDLGAFLNDLNSIDQKGAGKQAIKDDITGKAELKEEEKLKGRKLNKEEEAEFEKKMEKKEKQMEGKHKKLVKNFSPKGEGEIDSKKEEKENKKNEEDKKKEEKDNKALKDFDFSSD